jgi:hypothetical protein
MILDDATCEIYYAQLVVGTLTRMVIKALREVIKTRGLLCSLYSHRAATYLSTVRAGDKVDKHCFNASGRLWTMIRSALLVR